MADRVTRSHCGAGPKRIKQSVKRSRSPEHHATKAEHDMDAFQDIPPLTNLSSFPLLIPSTQNIVLRPSLPRHAPFTPQDESDSDKSNPERESETQPTHQTHTQTQTQTQPPPRTSKIGSSSNLDDPRTTIVPGGDRKFEKKKSQPPWIGDAAYAKLSEFWRTLEFVRKSHQVKTNRNEDSSACMHTTESKPHVVVWLELKEKNDGVDPPMDKYFSRTHKYQKDSNVGNWVSQQSQAKFILSRS